MHHPMDRIIHTTAFVKPVVEHWLEGEIAQWVHPMNALTTELHLAPQTSTKTKSESTYFWHTCIVWEQNICGILVVDCKMFVCVNVCMYIYECMYVWKEGKFHLTTHSTHFFTRRTYGKGPLSERGNQMPPLHGLLFPFSSKGSFI